MRGWTTLLVAHCTPPPSEKWLDHKADQSLLTRMFIVFLHARNTSSRHGIATSVHLPSACLRLHAFPPAPLRNVVFTNMSANFVVSFHEMKA